MPGPRSSDLTTQAKSCIDDTLQISPLKQVLCSLSPLDGILWGLKYGGRGVQYRMIQACPNPATPPSCSSPTEPPTSSARWRNTSPRARARDSALSPRTLGGSDRE